ncbi:MAG: hypothetical protein KUG81_04165 [Gammaproteobacteria bacterium]|nr:hypothetical protein [Gammaproteobacteria bacterium]
MKLELTEGAAQAAVVKILMDLDIEVIVHEDDATVEIVPEVEDMMLIHHVILDAVGVIDYKGSFVGQKIVMEWITIDSEMISSYRLLLTG